MQLVVIERRRFGAATNLLANQKIGFYQLIVAVWGNRFLLRRRAQRVLRLEQKNWHEIRFLKFFIQFCLCNGFRVYTSINLSINSKSISGLMNFVFYWEIFGSCHHKIRCWNKSLIWILYECLVPNGDCYWVFPSFLLDVVVCIFIKGTLRTGRILWTVHPGDGGGLVAPLTCRSSNECEPSALAFRIEDVSSRRNWPKRRRRLSREVDTLRPSNMKRVNHWNQFKRVEGIKERGHHRK